jgi:hypothetical protein
MGHRVLQIAARFACRARWPGAAPAHRGALHGAHWFVGVLEGELREKRATIDEALKALENYHGGRGHGAGLRDWWRDKRNREIEAARKARRGL